MTAGPTGWPVSWMFWHPHQQLWNLALVSAVERAVPISAIRKPIVGMIMLIDTFLLFVRAVARRSSVLGVTKIFAKARMRDFLEQINRERGVSVLLVEQNARMALGIATRAYVMETGRVALSGPSATLAESPHVKAAYLGG